MQFDKLEKLGLGSNLISEIKIFAEVNFKNLKELNLSSNKISSIKVLEKIKFDKLKILNLSGNNIIINNDYNSIISRFNSNIYN